MYIFNKEFEGNVFKKMGGKKIILSDKLSKKELKYLFELNHPAVKFIPKLKNEDDKDI